MLSSVYQREDANSSCTYAGRACAQPVSSGKAFARGELVALPTETVYGLAADALNPAAVVENFRSERATALGSADRSFAGLSWLEQIALIKDETRSLLEKLTARFWPGPLTFVLPRKESIPDLVVAGLETVAVRMSAHPVFAETIREFGRPLAAPSANRFGRISPTTAEHVNEELDGRISLIVDAGPTNHGIESTIVALRSGELEILRRGAVTEEALSEFGIVRAVLSGAKLEAPGQLPSHYAPATPVSLVKEPTQFCSTAKQAMRIARLASDASAIL